MHSNGRKVKIHKTNLNECICRNIPFVYSVAVIIAVVERMHISFSLYKDYILISVYCGNTEFWCLSRLTVWLHKGPSIFNYRLVYFFIWDSMFLDWDSIFFTRWVPGLIITICNQNHWIYIILHVSNFSIEKQYHSSILLHHSST